VAAIALVCVYTLNVLLQPDVTQLFQAFRGGEAQLSRPAKHGIWLTVVLGFVLNLAPLALRGQPSPDDAGSNTMAVVKGAMVWSVSCGWRGEQLTYVVLQGSDVGSTAPMQLSSGDTAALHLPDGTDVQLPDSHLLHELVNGRYRTSDARVTFGELKAFLASGPDEYTIDAVRAFVEALRAGRQASPAQ
jgi:hypothetical protein